jgi:hypothetical protein
MTRAETMQSGAMEERRYDPRRDDAERSDEEERRYDPRRDDAERSDEEERRYDLSGETGWAES